MTKGQIEAKISEVVSKFEIEYMGRGPKQIKTMICEDTIIIRLVRFLSPAEKSLSTLNDGAELLKRFRYSLFELAKDRLKELLEEIIDAKITNIYSDLNTTSGEKVIIVTLDRNYDKEIK